MGLDALIGEWEVVATLSDGTRASTSHAAFEWIADGGFVLLRSRVEELIDVWQGRAPETTAAIIGADDRTGRYGYLYTDSRDVHRVAEMTLEDGEWRIWGQPGPEFHQRFIGVVSGDRIDGRWERSTDGETWELDFELTYTRK
jgi:hypothetical protein